MILIRRVLIVLASAASTVFASPPTVAVWEYQDSTTSAIGAARLLEEVGFQVNEIDVTHFSDAFSADTIVLGSFVSEHPDYGWVMKRYKVALGQWVKKGGVLLQMVQSADVEPEPPFLPDGLDAHRDNIWWDLLCAENAATTPLLSGLLMNHPDGPRFPLPGRDNGLASWHTFDDYRGWAVHLWSDAQLPYRDAALLEAGHGTGRFLLLAIPLDKLWTEDGTLVVDDPYPIASEVFFGNFFRYVVAFRSGELEPQKMSEIEPRAAYDWTPGSWWLVVLPDTQHAVEHRPDVLRAQTTWIAEQKDVHDIRLVIHEGDVTNDGSRQQWKRARRAFRRLDHQVPYAATTGNHDYQRGVSLAERRSHFGEYFTAEDARSQTTFGGLFSDDRPENQFHTFTAGPVPWLVMMLEYLPSAEVVAWATGVIAKHPEHQVILVTHSYLGDIDVRIDLDVDEAAPLPEIYHDGEDLWRVLVSQHPSIRLVLCGHITGDGAGRLEDHVSGSVVHQILANYQNRRDGGEGWLRIMEFLPDGHHIRVMTYSPWLDEYMTGPQHQFELELSVP